MLGIEPAVLHPRPSVYLTFYFKTGSVKWPRVALNSFCSQLVNCLPIGMPGVYHQAQLIICVSLLLWGVGAILNINSRDFSQLTVWFCALGMSRPMYLFPSVYIHHLDFCPLQYRLRTPAGSLVPDLCHSPDAFSTGRKNSTASACFP